MLCKNAEVFAIEMHAVVTRVNPAPARATD